MLTWIALFRGINVGGNNILPMASLKAILQSSNCANVRTYIQSGNVVFESKSRQKPLLTKKIESAVETQHGFAPRLKLMSLAELASAVERNPFVNATSDPKSLHFFFLAEQAKSADMDKLKKAKATSESYMLIGDVFYLFAPDGIGRSKLAANAERYLGVTATARNFRTVENLFAIASQSTSTSQS